MPKVKTRSSAKKRFKITGSGKIAFKHVGMRHNLGKKNIKQKRRLGKTIFVSSADQPRTRKMLNK